MSESVGLVSIMMPAFNAENFIASAIESILAQTYQNWELIIVNDGSTDRTGDIISQFKDERIQIFNQENCGEAAARNLALSKMNGQFLAFLDSDDKYLPEFLRKMVAYITNHPKLDAVYCDGFYIDTRENVIEPLSNHRRGPFIGNLFEPLVRASDVFGPPICTLIKRNLIEINKLNFDTEIIIGPDWDFFIKISPYLSWGYLDEKEVHYRVHQTNITVTTGSEKRRASLEICRQNAIQNKLFNECSSETKFYVFYDLLINLLFDQPDKQNAVINSVKFNLLTRKIQAKLIRLSAASAVLVNMHSEYPDIWLKKSLELNPTDVKTWTLFFIQRISLNLAQKVLKQRYKSLQSLNNSPFKIKL